MSTDATPQGLAQRGETLFSNGLLHQSIASFTAAIDKSGGEAGSTYAWAFAHRGVARYALGDLAGAVTDFTRALTLRPEYAWAEAHLGEAYRMLATRAVARRGQLGGSQDDLQKAIAHLNKAVAGMPESAWAYAHRGAAFTLAYWIQANSEGKDWALLAHADLKQAVALNPGYAWAHAFRAFLYTLQDATDDAREMLAVAMLADVNQRLAVRRAMAELYSFDREYDQSLTSGYQQLQIDPEDFYARYYVAVALKQLGDKNAGAAIEASRVQLRDLQSRLTLLLGGLDGLEGNQDGARAALARIAEYPEMDTLAILRRDTAWDALREDPEYKKLFS